MKAIGVWPADGRLDRRARAGERHVDQIEIVREAELLARKMRGRTDAGTREGILAGIVADELHQFLDVLRRHRGVHDHDVRRIGDERDRREVLHGIVGHLGVKAHVDHEAGRHDVDGVAIRRARARPGPPRCCRPRRRRSRHRTAGRAFRRASAPRCARSRRSDRRLQSRPRCAPACSDSLARTPVAVPNINATSATSIRIGISLLIFIACIIGARAAQNKGQKRCSLASDGAYRSWLSRASFNRNDGSDVFGAPEPFATPRRRARARHQCRAVLRSRFRVRGDAALARAARAPHPDRRGADRRADDGGVVAVDRYRLDHQLARSGPSGGTAFPVRA